MGLQFVSDNRPKTNDFDMVNVRSSASYPCSVNTKYVVVTHNIIDITAKPILKVNDIETPCGDVGSGDDFEMRRVSGTQTVIVIKNPAIQPVKILGVTFTGIPDGEAPLPPPIGDGIIGSSFIVQ